MSAAMNYDAVARDLVDLVGDRVQAALLSVVQLGRDDAERFALAWAGANVANVTAATFFDKWQSGELDEATDPFDLVEAMMKRQREVRNEEQPAPEAQP